MFNRRQIVSETTPQMIFEVIQGAPQPRLPRGRDGVLVPDGARYLTPAQCAERFGNSEAHWRTLWETTWSGYMPPADAVLLSDGATEGPDAPPPSDPAVRASLMAEEDCVRAVRFPKLNDAQWAFVMNHCRRLRISPRNVWARIEGEEVMIITTIAAFRAVAERTKRRGKEHLPEFAGPDLMWTSAWTEQRPPYAARVLVDRLNRPDEPDEGIAIWELCAQYETGPDGQPRLNEFWSKGPLFMLGKCAAANAYRVGYAEELAGLYTIDEIHVKPREARAPAAAARPAEVREEAADVFNAGTGEVVGADKPEPAPEIRDDPKFAWGLVDDTTPDSPQSLLRSLLEVGASSLAHAQSVVNLFREKLPRLAANHFQGFCAVVLWAVRTFPRAYGMGGM